MDIFKNKQGLARILKISEKNFVEQTNKKLPYTRQNSSGGLSHFAVCPECENPIQIIGLFKNTAESGRRPYGKHYSQSIPGLAIYNHDDYLD